MKKSGVIEINGRRYSVHDGKRLDIAEPPQAEHEKAATKSKPVVSSRQKAAFAKRHPQNRSKLLMRQAVRPPVAFVRVTYRANGTLQPEVLIESNVPLERIARRTNHAKNVHKSQSIKHFDRYAVSHYVNNDIVQPVALKPPISDFNLGPIQNPRPTNKPRTSAEVLELAMANVNLYEPSLAPQKTSFFKLKRRSKNFAR